MTPSALAYRRWHTHLLSSARRPWFHGTLRKGLAVIQSMWWSRWEEAGDLGTILEAAVHEDIKRLRLG